MFHTHFDTKNFRLLRNGYRLIRTQDGWRLEALAVVETITDEKKIAEFIGGTRGMQDLEPVVTLGYDREAFKRRIEDLGGVSKKAQEALFAIIDDKIEEYPEYANVGIFPGDNEGGLTVQVRLRPKMEKKEFEIDSKGNVL